MSELFKCSFANNNKYFANSSFSRLSKLCFFRVFLRFIFFFISLTTMAIFHYGVDWHWTGSRQNKAKKKKMKSVLYTQFQHIQLLYMFFFFFIFISITVSLIIRIRFHSLSTFDYTRFYTLSFVFLLYNQSFWGNVGERKRKTNKVFLPCAWKISISTFCQGTWIIAFPRLPATF